MISPQSLMITVLLTVPGLEPSFSIFLTTAKLIPMSASFPNTTCFPEHKDIPLKNPQMSHIYSPSRWGAGMVVMKNWLPLVSGPVLAMLSRPGIS